MLFLIFQGSCAPWDLNSQSSAVSEFPLCSPNILHSRGSISPAVYVLRDPCSESSMFVAHSVPYALCPQGSTVYSNDSITKGFTFFKGAIFPELYLP